MLDEVTKIRIQAWTMAGVDIELDIMSLTTENDWLRRNDEGNADIVYNNKQLTKLKSQLELVNSHLSKLTVVNDG